MENGITNIFYSHQQLYATLCKLIATKFNRILGNDYVSSRAGNTEIYEYKLELGFRYRKRTKPPVGLSVCVALGNDREGL